MSTKPAAPASSAPHSTSSSPNVVSTSTASGSAAAAQPRRRGDPVENRHADVHQHHVGLHSQAARRPPAGRRRTRRRPRTRPPARGSAPARRERSPDRRRARPGSLPGASLIGSPSASSGSRQLTRQPSGVGPAVELAAQRGRPLTHADQAIVRPARLPRRRRARRPGGLRYQRDIAVGELQPEHRSRTRRVPGRVGERLLRDPVQRSPTPAGIRESSPAQRSSTARPPARASSTSPGISAAPGNGGKRGSSSLRSRATVRAARACCDGRRPRPSAAPPRPRRGRAAEHDGRS